MSNPQVGLTKTYSGDNMRRY